MSVSHLADQTLGQIANDLPGATRIFHNYRLDFCCGGGRTLRESAARRELDLEMLVTALENLSPESQNTDWRQQSAVALIDHLLENFHAKHRLQLPELVRLARRVETVHGDRPDCPVGLADLLTDMQHELESHMMKEEQILFPMLRQLPVTAAAAPISVMRHEHDQHGEELARIDDLTGNIVPPGDACNTWRALYRGLKELKEDLMEHIHLENNVLFAGNNVKA